MNYLAKIKTNWKSGITVSLVSIPLSVSLAVASQATPTVGIITAIWAGLLASIFGGSNYNIVGPTGALSGIIAAYAVTQGADTLPMLAIIAGVLIFFAYIAKLEKYLVFVPASTIHGFTLGVAFIIALNQLNFALGLTGLTVHEKFVDNLIESFTHIGAASVASVAVFFLFLISLFLLRKFLPQIPGAILLTPIGVVVGYLSINSALPFQLLTLGDRFKDISPMLFIAPQFSFKAEMILPAFTIALVAVLETMLSAKIADGRTKTKHNKRKEMLGLSIANIGSGLAGGIPATAALARTSLNISSGADDKISATISSVFIAIISFFLLAYFKFVPLTVIAAILVFVAIRMVELDQFKRMWKLDKQSFFISIFVAAVTVLEDPIIGILAGTVIALLIFVEKISRGQFEARINDEEKNLVAQIDNDEYKVIENGIDTLVYSIKGQLVYINGQAHIARFEGNLIKSKNIILRLRELDFIDLDGIDALDEIGEILEKQKKKVYITGVNDRVKELLNESSFYTRQKKKGYVYDKTSEVLNKLGYAVH